MCASTKKAEPPLRLVRSAAPMTVGYVLGYQFAGRDRLTPKWPRTTEFQLDVGAIAASFTIQFVFAAIGAQSNMKTNEQHVVEVETDAVRRLDTRVRHRHKVVCTIFAVIPVVAVALVGLVLLDVTLETYFISRSPVSILLNPTICTPAVLNASNIEYHSEHHNYSTLTAMERRPQPVFRADHTILCNEWTHTLVKYSHCLPISGRKDTPFCETPDRMDLLDLSSSKSICYASVLHMIMVEVYEELQATGNTPFLTFGSLLGAVRNHSVIPFTEDADVGFVGDLQEESSIEDALWKKGYHMFRMNIWRVCVAPTHPLAGHLYDPSLPITKEYTVPYVDLYPMKQQKHGDWDLQELKGRNLPDRKVQPFSQVTVNGMQFDSVHDPEYFLKQAYGSDYMTPKPRGK